MSLLQTNSALALAEPLLEQEAEATKQQECEKKQPSKYELWSRFRFVLLGIATGFFIQVVSLGAYVFLLMHYNGMSLRDSGVLGLDGFFRHNNATVTLNNGERLSGSSVVWYTLLSVLTQLDLVVYFLIWVGFTCTMTRDGMNCIRSHFVSSEVRRRTIFVWGVCFLVGIVVGAFAAWSTIDLYLDFPVPLEPILATVMFDLALCYLMVLCFDLGKSSADDDHEDEEGDGEEGDDEAPPCC